jgi:hypothetical protein
MIGNLTAQNWNGRGWLAVRPHLAALNSPPPATVNFSGPPAAWSNLFVVGFGPPASGAVSPVVSDGKITIHCGASSSTVTTFITIDLYAYLSLDR